MTEGEEKEYDALTMYGHSAAKAMEIVLDAKRGDARAVQWIALCRKLEG
jgi:hypothetical protein